MSELRPSNPVRRPDTARPRDQAEIAVAPPTPDEVARIQRHLATLPVFSGAVTRDDQELGLLLVRSPLSGPGVNYGALPRWSRETWRAQLGRFEAHMHAEGEWPSLLVAERMDRPIGLAEQLTALGWSALVRETVLWVGHASIVPHLDPSLRIEAVQPGDTAAHEALESAVFGLGERGASDRRAWLANAIERQGLRAYLVRVHDEPVAVTRLAQAQNVAGLYAIGVAERWRRKGLGTLITTVATRAGLAMGNRIVWLSVVDGNDAAAEMYRKLGFRPLFSWARWLAPSPQP